MQADSTQPPAKQTFIEERRRAQIVEAAIAAIAEVGYAKTSFAEIARRAGLSSTGIISYHFSSKQDLNEQIVAIIVEGIGDYMTRHMEGIATPPDALNAYIGGLIAYMRLEGPRMQALTSIVLHGGVVWNGDQQEDATDGLRNILRWGQEAGSFRAFDIDVMATTIQRSLDGIPFLQMIDPDLDLARYASELVEIFTLATRQPA